MTIQRKNPPGEEVARIGTEIYDRNVRPIVEKDNYGKVVAIDIYTGEYAIADTALAASDDILARLPTAFLWLVRIGHRGLYRFGYHSTDDA